MYAGAGNPLHRRKSRSRRHSPAGPRRAASGARALSQTLCCCGAPPRSCCSGRAPRRPSFCRSTHAWGMICRLCPQHTWRVQGTFKHLLIQTSMYKKAGGMSLGHKQCWCTMAHQKALTLTWDLLFLIWSLCNPPSYGFSDFLCKLNRNLKVFFRYE